MTKIEEKYDLINKIFGRLTVTGYSNVKRNGRARYWQCKCECGKEAIIRGSSLKDGTTKSCGCLNTDTRRSLIKKVNVTHGMSNTKEFNAWRAMIERCNNRKSPKYYRYGGRGIKVCKRWAKSFINFYEDMGNAPSRRHSLDRKQNNKGYYKSNCRWATSKEQSNNRSTNRRLKIDGIRINIIDACRYVGISYPAFVRKLKKGWSAQKIKDKYYQINLLYK